MEKVTFGEWLPDQPPVAGALVEAKNVIPQQIGYGPLPTVSAISNDAGENINSVFSGRFGDTIKVFASSSTKLYEYSSNTLDLSNISQAGNYSASDSGRWSTAQFGKVVLAANGEEIVQAYTLGTSSNFADLASAAPTAHFVSVVRDFVVCGKTNEEPNKVLWSDINDETDWSSGPTSQSDFQLIADGGNIQGLTGGEFGLIFLQKGISRMTYAGAPLYFQFDTISRGLGCLEPKSIAQYGNLSFFLSDDGFYLCDGTQVQPIGAEKIDRFFFNDAEIALLSTMSVAVDPIRRCIFWMYTNNSSVQSILIYNWQIQKWSRGETTADFVNSIETEGISVESLDNYASSIDALTISLDDRFWVANSTLLAGVQGQKIVAFSGENTGAEIITGDLVGRNSVINLAKPQIDSGTANVSVASRARLDGEITFGTVASADDENRCAVRSHGRYHRVKVLPSGDYTAAVGVDLDIKAGGMR
jgi:hypothetical protein